MADICLKLARDYGTMGAKYDLYNCIPDVRCESCDHEHDTDSEIIGLERTMKLIWERIAEYDPNYIVELKQNYGGPFLSQYGTMMRAGDTPYNPEDNFLRTAHIQAYTPYALNDYQTITGFDTPEESAMIIIKMLAAGIPSYSVNLAELPKTHARVMKHYNSWYLGLLPELESYERTPLDAELQTWRLSTEKQDIYFAINGMNSIEIVKAKDFSVLNGSITQEILMKDKSGGKYSMAYYNCFGEKVGEETRTPEGILNVPIGGMVVARRL